MLLPPAYGHDELGHHPHRIYKCARPLSRPGRRASVKSCIETYIQKNHGASEVSIGRQGRSQRACGHHRLRPVHGQRAEARHPRRRPLRLPSARTVRLRRIAVRLQVKHDRPSRPHYGAQNEHGPDPPQQDGVSGVHPRVHQSPSQGREQRRRAARLDHGEHRGLPARSTSPGLKEAVPRGSDDERLASDERPQARRSVGHRSDRHQRRSVQKRRFFGGVLVHVLAHARR